MEVVSGNLKYLGFICFTFGINATADNIALSKLPTTLRTKDVKVVCYKNPTVTGDVPSHGNGWMVVLRKNVTILNCSITNDKCTVNVYKFYIECSNKTADRLKSHFEFSCGSEHKFASCLHTDIWTRRNGLGSTHPSTLSSGTERSNVTSVSVLNSTEAVTGKSTTLSSYSESTINTTASFYTFRQILHLATVPVSHENTTPQEHTENRENVFSVAQTPSYIKSEKSATILSSYAAPNGYTENSESVSPTAKMSSVIGPRDRTTPFMDSHKMTIETSYSSENTVDPGVHFFPMNEHLGTTDETINEASTEKSKDYTVKSLAVTNGDKPDIVTSAVTEHSFMLVSDQWTSTEIVNTTDNTSDSYFDAFSSTTEQVTIPVDFNQSTSAAYDPVVSRKSLYTFLAVMGVVLFASFVLMVICLCRKKKRGKLDTAYQEDMYWMDNDLVENYERGVNPSPAFTLNPVFKDSDSGKRLTVTKHACIGMTKRQSGKFRPPTPTVPVKNFSREPDHIRVSSGDVYALSYKNRRSEPATDQWSADESDV